MLEHPMSSPTLEGAQKIEQTEHTRTKNKCLWLCLPRLCLQLTALFFSIAVVEVRLHRAQLGDTNGFQFVSNALLILVGEPMPPRGAQESEETEHTRTNNKRLLLCSPVYAYH